MSQPTISFRYAADSGYDDDVIIYLDDMTEDQQNDDGGVWGTMIVVWSAGTTVRVDLAGYSPAEAMDKVADVDDVVEDWLDHMAYGTLDWNIEEFNTPNEDVQDAILTEFDTMLTTPEDALAAYLDDADMLDVPEHLDAYRGVIYDQVAANMIAAGEVTIGDVAIFRND